MLQAFTLITPKCPWKLGAYVHFVHASTFSCFMNAWAACSTVSQWYSKTNWPWCFTGSHRKL